MCREIGYTVRRDHLLTPVTTVQLFLLQFGMATPPAAIYPICRTCGSARRPTVMPPPDSRCASLTPSWSASAARHSDLPRTTGGGMGIGLFRRWLEVLHEETRPGRHGPFPMEVVRSASGKAWYTVECPASITAMPRHRTSACRTSPAVLMNGIHHHG